jgi:CRISPR system Cascade subunit CasD
MQAWDTQSNFGVRTTGREPSKSGVIGLLCAALGRERDEPVDDLAALKMGVRVDREGHILRDWHTAGKDGYLKASGAIEQETLITSTRYYLTDAAFLVGLESNNRALLEEIHNALHHPHWMLFLGRKACPPSEPPYLSDGLKDGDLLTALETYPWLGRLEKRYQRIKEKNPKLRIVLDDPDHGEQVRNDYPISFEKGNRRFAPRRVHTDWIEWPMFRETVKGN